MMETITIELTKFDYMNLRQLIRCTADLKSKKPIKLSGTKMIHYDLVVIAMLRSRYHFLYDEDEVFKGLLRTRLFSLAMYQAAALYYYLQDTENLTASLENLRHNLGIKLEPHLYKQTPVSEFQEYYEQNLMEDWELGYTELRDEHPQIYNFLYKRFKESQP